LAVVDGTDFKGFSDAPRRAVAKPRSRPLELPGMGAARSEVGSMIPQAGN
jgi:hypothetical protein